MKKTQIIKILGLLLCFGMLTGCESRPTSVPADQVETSSSAESQTMEESISKEESTESTSTQEMESSEVEVVEDEIISFTISATGDVSLGNLQIHGYEGTFNEMWDLQSPGYFFESVKEIFQADDMTIVNFEGVLTNTNKRVEKLYNIKGKPEYVQILVEGDVEAAAMGNNHRMDYGEEGLADTVAALESVGIVYGYDDILGYYEDEETGIKVGFVSVNEVYDETLVETYLKEGIEILKEDQTVDLIFACCHWGDELDRYPNEYELNLGKQCIDWGADLVLGHHPHVMQGIEEYKGRFIVYSLGNFCFGGNKNPKEKDTMIFQQTFTFVNGEKQEDQVIKVIPCTISSVSKRNDFQPTPVTGEDAIRVIDKINKYSKQFDLQFDYEGYPTIPEASQETTQPEAKENASQESEASKESNTSSGESAPQESQTSKDSSTD
ncbi:MAG: CapA family protein [Lachnospiraceae bacterium]|nr:CapA family protein [Lachnospiraceae bacterium]